MTFPSFTLNSSVHIRPHTSMFLTELRKSHLHWFIDTDDKKKGEPQKARSMICQSCLQLWLDISRTAEEPPLQHNAEILLYFPSFSFSLSPSHSLFLMKAHKHWRTHFTWIIQNHCMNPFSSSNVNQQKQSLLQIVFLLQFFMFSL